MVKFCRHLLLITVSILCMVSLMLQGVFAQTVQKSLTPDSTVKLTVDGYNLPVYRVEGNYFVSVEQLSSVGYDVYNKDNQCIMIFRNPQKPKISVSPQSYTYKFTPKPYVSCYIDGYRIPVLFIDGKPFIFANELFKENKVEKNEHGYNIKLCKPRNYTRETALAQYLGQDRLMDNDVVMYLVHRLIPAEAPTSTGWRGSGLIFPSII